MDELPVEEKRIGSEIPTEQDMTPDPARLVAWYISKVHRMTLALEDRLKESSGDLTDVFLDDRGIVRFKLGGLPYRIDVTQGE